MRIDSIDITNLASLRGRQPTIDLRGPELGEADLIAVTGPTGAGKTTLFDAVCLALFDQTPRTRGRNRDPRELLSRGAAEAAVAVGLELDDGRRWRAEWSVHRARNQPDGALQATRQWVVDRATGATLAEGKKAVRDLIDGALGLSFEQFTSVVLIAQGEFARFLEANDADRSSLLEKLTGTEIYSELSRAAFEENRRLQEKVAELEQRLAQLRLLPEERRLELETELANLQADQRTFDLQLERERQELRWRRDLLELADRHREADDERAAAEAEIAAAQPDQLQLDAAGRAALVATAALGADNARRRCRELEASLATIERQLDEARRETAARRTDLAGRFRQLEIALAEAARSLEETRGAAALGDGSLDRLRHEQRRIEQEDEQFLREKRLVEETARESKERAAEARLAAETLEATRVERQEAEEAEKSVRGEWQELAGHRDRHHWERRRLHLQQALDQAEAVRRLDLERLEADYRAAREAQRRSQQALDASRRQLDDAKTALRVHESLLRRAFEAQELAKHRPLLAEGEPCPLCGSLDHPWAGRALDHERELHAEAEKRRLGLADEVVAAEQNARRAGDDDAKTRAALEGADAARHQANRQRANALARWAELRFELIELPPEPDGFVTGELAAIDRRLEALDALQPRVAAAESVSAEARRRESAVEQAAALAVARREHAAQRRVQAASAAAERSSVLAELRSDRDALASKLARSLGRQPPAETQMSAFLAGLSADLAAWQKAQLQVETLRHLQRSFESRLAEIGPIGQGLPLPPLPAEALETALDEAWRLATRAAGEENLQADRRARAQSELASSHEGCRQAESAFSLELASHGFADEAAWQEARLDASSLAALRGAIERRRSRRDRAAAQAEAAAALLAAHRAKAPEGLAIGDDLLDLASLADQEAALAQREGERRQLGERSIAARLELAQDDTRRHQGLSWRAELAELRVVAERAARLNALIGQKDGGKFRRFAQQLNLDQLLGLANRRLDRLAPRYQLARVGDNLDLEAIDRDMADERRPISTLSGGESFLVSLALALGLADLRRGKLALGTLFLDEGFGSLDEDTLDTALAVLEQLQADQNTQILIISHVGALKDRIDHRIDVRKLGGGRSRLAVMVGQAER